MNMNTSHTRTEKLLLEAARTFNSTLEYEELVERILRLVVAAADSQAAFLFRVDHERTDMRVRFMDCRDCKVQTFKRELGEGVDDWLAHYREPVIVSQADSDPRVDQEIGRMGGMAIRSMISVPLIGKGQNIGVIQAINKVGDSFHEADLDVLMGLANQIAVALDNAALYRAMKREALEKQLLYDTGIRLSGRLRLDEVLRGILSSLNQVIEFDAAGVYLTNPKTSDIEAVYLMGRNTEDDPQLKIGQGLLGTVAESGEPVIVADVSVDKRYINGRESTKSEIVVPIMLEDKTIGVINLESDRPAAFNNRDASLMSAFAAQAAISIERARLHEKIIASQKLEEQVHIAREIQQSFLPRQNPVMPGYDVSGRNIPSFEVGGDYYDFITIVEGQTGIAIGDVSGKGIPASLIMASFRASLIAEIRNNYSIRTICNKVNNLLYESVRSGSFVSAVYGVLDSKNHVLTFCNCGHNLPIVLKSNDEVEYLREGGQLFGVTPNVEYEERPIYLRPNDIVVLYTDGVTEVFNSEGEEFGMDGVIDILRQNRDKPSSEIQQAIYDAVLQFASSEHVFDDLTMIVIKRLALD
jgi:sigma-B regulation protein RsbU (phosphoserine phosphatase)